MIATCNHSTLLWGVILVFMGGLTLFLLLSSFRQALAMYLMTKGRTVVVVKPDAEVNTVDEFVATAIKALIQLGYSKEDATARVKRARQLAPKADLEILVNLALRD
jgi:Holliday junction resolvasome RuvABC DNA-binding subunit